MNNSKCPICLSTEFGDFRGRKKVRCVGCGSFERSRYLWNVLSGVDLSNLNGDILHIAPEVGIASKLAKKYGNQYSALDYDPSIYFDTDIKVKPIDLCTDLMAIEDNSVAAIIHVHVLEHVRCNVSLVLQQLNRIIRPGGYHIFGLPFMAGYYKEDLNPALTDKYRLTEFGHEDHVRLFGTEDWAEMFKPIFTNFQEIEASSISSPKLMQQSRIPIHALQGLSGHSINVWKKVII